MELLLLIPVLCVSCTSQTVAYKEGSFVAHTNSIASKADSDVTHTTFNVKTGEVTMYRDQKKKNEASVPNTYLNWQGIGDLAGIAAGTEQAKIGADASVNKAGIQAGVDKAGIAADVDKAKISADLTKSLGQ